MVKLSFMSAMAAIAGLAYSQCANPMQRPEIRSLSAQDRARYLRAVNQLRENGELDRLSSIHVENADTIHGHPRFLVFHRHFMNDFANALQRVDPGVPVPYWDWSLDASNPAASALFTDSFLGGNGSGPNGCVQSGPLANWQMRVSTPHCLARRFNNGDQISPFWPPEALLSMQNTVSQYGALSSGIENGCHGAVHLGISGDMSTMFAPNDPFFFLHHGMVDKLWYDWQLMNPETRFAMYDNSNYQDPPVSADEVLPGYPNVRVRDVLDPRSGALCYVYVDSGSGAATKRLMQEVDRQAQQQQQQQPQGGPQANQQVTGGPAALGPMSGPTGPNGPTGFNGPVGPAGPAGPAGPVPQQQPLAPGRQFNSDAPQSAAPQPAATANQGQPMRGGSRGVQDFVQNALASSLGGTPLGAMNFGGHRHNRNGRLFRRLAYAAGLSAREYTGQTPAPAAAPSQDILGLGGLVNGLLGSDGLVAHLLEGVGNVVSVLPQGLTKTLEAVGEIAENVTSDVFDLLHVPKVDLSKLSKEERLIPAVQPLPDWWCQKNNLNATYAAQLHSQVHDIIEGFNRIPGYVSPAVVHYAAMKYGDKAGSK